MKKYINIVAVFSIVCTFGIAAYAAVTGDDISWFQKLFDYIGTLKDATPLLGKICGGIVILISTAKVSFIKPLWDKLGEKQEWLAPALGLLGGAAAMFLNGKFDLQLLLTAVAGGALAPYVHDILDLIKKIPGLGQVWLTIISLIEVIFLAPKNSAPSGS